MARSYAKLHTTIWQSRKFRSLAGNDQARLFYVYLHSCNQVNSVGCFRLPLGYAVTDTGWTEEQVLEAINSLSEANLIEWDADECSVRLIGYIEHDPPTNPKHGGAMRTIARSLPDGQQKLAVIKDLLAQPHCAKDAELREMHDRLSIAYKEAIPPYPVPVPIPVPNPSSFHSDVAAPPSAAPRSKSTKCQLPSDFPKKQDLEWAEKHWLSKGRGDLCAMIDDEIAKFRDHHVSQQKRSADWPASWRTWVRNAMNFTKANRNERSSKPTATDQHLAGIASIIDDIHAGRA